MIEPAPAASFDYVDLFAGIGGFHAMLDHAGGRCVYVSEKDKAARETYLRNWVEPLPIEEPRPTINHDITAADPAAVPPHMVLAAGFPCQPFSKSGRQRGMDEARGTLFWNIARILEEKKPPLVLLENVRNLAGPRHEHEWEVIIETLRDLGYRVSSTPTIFSPHLLPPEMGGTPQVRERVYILGTYIGPGRVRAELRQGLEPAPTLRREVVGEWSPERWRIEGILDDDDSIDGLDRYTLDEDEAKWVAAWDDFVRRMRASTGDRLPGFPLWSDDWVPESSLDPDALAALPTWKQDFLRKNARFYDRHRDVIEAWREAHPEVASEFPASRRKFEWQAQDAKSLTECVIQLRPSGVRVRRATYVPALVAINQTSIVGSRMRRLTPDEVIRLQGMPSSFDFGKQADKASYKQAGNGVSIGAAWHVFRAHVLNEREAKDLPPEFVAAVAAAGEAFPTAVTRLTGVAAPPDDKPLSGTTLRGVRSRLS
jgi:DNA (cytosine-5)-methyltransferase 1